MKDPVVMAVGDESGAYSVASRQAWKMMFVLGLAVALVSMIDLAMLIFPARLSSLDWEFGTISAVVDNLPLVTLGFGLMTASAVARGWTSGRRFMIGVLLVTAVIVAGMTVVFVLDIPAALRAVDPGLKPTIKKAVLKTSSMGLLYTLLYATLGIWAWRMRGTAKGAVR